MLDMYEEDKDFKEYVDRFAAHYNEGRSITVLEASAKDDNWSKSDTFMTAYRSTSISTSVVETTIKDMAEYYKTNILKL